MIAKHAVNDTAKLQAMVVAMADGWPKGMPPILVAGEHEALTGTHRLAAAMLAGIEPVVLDVQDTVDSLIEAGYDWSELICMDDSQLATAFRRVGRSDLAAYCD